MKTKEKTVVAVARFKVRDTNGNFAYLPGTKNFPIRATDTKHRDRAVSAFINRTVRKGKYYRHDVFCFIDDTEGKRLHMLKGGHEYTPGHRSLFRLAHLDGGQLVETIFSTPDMETDRRTAPWTLVNLYRPQRRSGFVAVYNNRTQQIVIRNGKELKWINGQRS